MFNKTLLSLSVLMFFIGAFILTDKNALGATTSYGETYEITKWRNMQVYDEDNPTSHYTSWVTLGPAEWKIAGTIGSSSFAETWKVPGLLEWDDGKVKPEWIAGFAGKPAFRFSTSAGGAYDFNQCQTTAEPAGRCDTHFGSGAAGTNYGSARLNPSSPYEIDIYSTGLYGALMIKHGDGLESSAHLWGAHSWPKKWEVTGTITSP